MTEIKREDISEILGQQYDGNSVNERNQQRREAVQEYLQNRSNATGLQGTVHDMILSDLQFYPEWEREE